LSREDKYENGFEFLDDVLDILDDEEWHDLEEIVEKTSLTEERVGEIMELLRTIELVKFQEKEVEKVKVGELGTTILELPSES